MALTNGDIINIVDTVLNKDLNGRSITASEFQTLINSQSKLLFASKLGVPNEYARDVPVARKGASVSRVIDSSLRPFLKREALVVTGGIADLSTLSATYSYLLAINPVSITGRGFDELTPDQEADRLGSSVVAPTEKDPAFTWNTPTQLLIHPSTITSVTVIYYKEPDDAVVVTKVNATTLDEEYDASSSTELEWEDTEKVQIAYRILRDAGINIERNDVVALAQQIVDSNE